LVDANAAGCFDRTMSEYRIDAPPVIPKQSAQRFGKRSTHSFGQTSVRHRPIKQEETKSRIRIGGMLLAVFGLCLVGHDPLIGFAANAAGCHIKGNISMNSGEKIFHAPGQADYDGTKISLLKGEKWFCTADDAMAAGWRKATN
jgi:hypothetical protein